MTRKQQVPSMRGAAVVADFIHRALHSDGRPYEQVGAMVRGTRRALMERARAVALARRDTAVSIQARTRWEQTAQLIHGELTDHAEAYTDAPLRITKDHAHPPRRPRRKKGDDHAAAS